jgi:hypothetical protein
MVGDRGHEQTMGRTFLSSVELPKDGCESGGKKRVV